MVKGSDEDRDELIGFAVERSQQVGWKQFFGGDELQPVSRFIKFTQAIAQLGNELGFGTATATFAVIRSDRLARPQKLFAQHLWESVFSKSDV